MDKFVIKDQNTGLYVQCWTEGNTIFLTSVTESIQEFPSLEFAKSHIQKILSNNCRFLKDSDDSEVSKVDLVAGTMTFVITFVPAT